MKKRIKLYGTTLIEMLIYFSLITVMMVAGVNFSLHILTASKQSDNFHELQSTMNFIADRLISTIETAESVHGDSVFDVDQGTISLTVSNPANSPTKLYLLNGNVYIQQGAAAAVQLNSTAVTYTKLRFHKISSSKTPDQITLDMQSSIDKDIASLDKQISFHTSISLRK